MSNERLVSETRKRIENRDYEAVFTSGCCFHFALYLHEKFNYKIRGIREGHGGKRFSHVWCQVGTNSNGVDIRGVYAEDLLVRLANGGSTAQTYDIPVDKVRDEICATGFPSDLKSEILNLADWVFNNHERFGDAKQFDEKRQNQALKNIEDESNRKFAA